MLIEVCGVQVAMPVRVMVAMGVKTLIVTNAAGGVNPEYQTGDLMLIKDHIDLPGLTGECVLIGKNDSRLVCYCFMSDGRNNLLFAHHVSHASWQKNYLLFHASCKLGKMIHD